MRELTKSMASFSWALSLFGVRQVANLMRPSQAATAFDAVARSTEGQLGEALHSFYEVGNRLQRSMVDITFGMMGLGNSGGRWTDMARDAVKSAADTAGSAVRNVSGGAGPGHGGGGTGDGWGPMPG